MKIEILKSYSQYTAAKLSTKFMTAKEHIITLDEADFAAVIGNANTGKLVHINIEGHLKLIKEYFDYLRPRRAERTLLMICANSNVAMSEIDELSKIAAASSYDCYYGVAACPDIFPHEFIVDFFCKYEPQGELRL